MGGKSNGVKYIVVNSEYDEGDGVVFESLKQATDYIQEMYEDQIQCRLFEATEISFTVQLKAKVITAFPETRR